jgi:hypothetical protein
MGVKASYGVGVKSAGVAPSSMKCLFNYIRSALTPFLPLHCTFFTYKKPVFEISRQIPIGERSSPLHPIPFVVVVDS